MANVERTAYNQYREFTNEAEVETWAREHYAGLLQMSPKCQLYEDIFSYTGNLFTSVNELMRALPPYGTPAFLEYSPGNYWEEFEMIPRIADVLNQNETPEDIIVYRFTHLKVMRNLCGTWLLRSGVTFSDKAFLSTTLLWKQLVPFGKDHHCNCMLKLYLPKGTHGAYVSLNDEWDRLREYEFLLPPNLRFKIVKCCFLSYPARIECVALVD